jgi:hypothetical protein
MNQSPKVFISYAWEDTTKAWVKQLATHLRENGIDAKLDQWEMVPGDQMTHFMETSVRDNAFVLIICTPKYKQKSEKRIGGVGYEGDIMTAEVLQTGNQRKFIPILQEADKNTSIPSWLQGKYFIDLSTGAHYAANFEDLLATLLNRRETAPALGQPSPTTTSTTTTTTTAAPQEDPFEIKIKGIIVDEVTSPRNDGTAGSALYSIPFELNKRPDQFWSDCFIQAWNRPPQFSTRHRPGIASVTGNKIILTGTTIEEVEQTHKQTLKLAVGVANQQYREALEAQRQRQEREQRAKDAHKKNINDISSRINFDD